MRQSIFNFVNSESCKFFKTLSLIENISSVYESRGKAFQEKIKIICEYTEARKNKRKEGRKRRKLPSKEEGLGYGSNSGKWGRGYEAGND